MIRNDDTLYMRTILEKPIHRMLTQNHYCEDFYGEQGMIPAGFEWDGSSVPVLLQGIFPRHRHPIASCRHDWRCRRAVNAEQRKWADEEFRKDVGETSWWITKQIGYLGVRIGAMFGVGSNF